MLPKSRRPRHRLLKFSGQLIEKQVRYHVRVQDRLSRRCVNVANADRSCAVDANRRAPLVSVLERSFKHAIDMPWCGAAAPLTVARAARPHDCDGTEDDQYRRLR